MNLKFIVATNFDNRLIENIAGFGTVESLYGKLAYDIVGGGRSGLILPKISMEKLKEHIGLVHKNGTKFNYLLNAACLGNREFVRKTHYKIVKFIERVRNIGVDAVTVSNEFLLELIKKQFPELTVSASIFCNIDSLQKIKYFEDMGADALALCDNFARDFEQLEKAVKIAKSQLVLIANNICLFDCPYLFTSHANLPAHSSQQSDQSRGFYIDFFALRCYLERTKNPTKLITSRWIRPEDVGEYERIGNGKLILKLADRARTTKWLTRTVRAYSQRKYEGNLLDILNCFSTKDRDTFGYVDAGPMLRPWKADLSRLVKYAEALWTFSAHIDNERLSELDFLEGFKDKHCSQMVCNDQGWIGDNEYYKKSGDCKYCRTIAEKVVTIDPELRTHSIKKLEEVIRDCITSKMFEYHPFSLLASLPKICVYLMEERRKRKHVKGS